MDGIKDSVAVVTGAASGIGRATAMCFARNGAKVGLIDVDETGLAETVRAIEGGGGEALAYPASTSSLKGVGAAMDAIERKLGPIVMPSMARAFAVSWPKWPTWRSRTGAR